MTRDYRETESTMFLTPFNIVKRLSVLSSAGILHVASSSLSHFHTQPSTTPPIASKTQDQEDLPLDEPTVLAALSSYSNDWPRALEFHRWASAHSSFCHTPSTLAATVDILGKHFEFPLALSLLSSSTPPPTLPLRSLLNRLVAAHLVTEAIQSLHDLHSFDSASYHLLLDALSDHGHILEAQNLLKDSPFPISTKSHNIILRGWLKVRAFPRCRYYWLEMDRLGVDKDLHSYSIFMDCLLKSGKPWKAVKLYKEMNKKGILLDVVAYNTAIHAIGSSEGVDRAIGLYKEMLEMGCRPNVATFNTIIKLLCEVGRMKEGYAFVDRMRKEGCEPNVITYHCFFRNSSRPKEMLWLFERMVERGCRPRMDTYVMLMKKFGKWGFLRPVFIVWRAMEKSGCSPDAFAYNALIDALLQKGMVEMARKYDKEMLAKGLSPRPRKELGTKYIESEQPGNVDDDDDVVCNVF